MKKWIVAFVVVAMWPILWAGTSDNLLVTSGTVYTSTGDMTGSWTLGSTAVLRASSPVTFAGGNFNVRSYADENPGKRYVSVWIIDQDVDVPLDKSLLYEERMIFTDRNADEIQAGIPLLKILADHNRVREGLKNKDGKPLKKIRLRDLQIVIRNW